MLSKCDVYRKLSEITQAFDQDENIFEVQINGFEHEVHVSSLSSLKKKPHFSSEVEFTEWLKHLAYFECLPLNSATPFQGGQLNEGYRWQAAIPPASTPNSQFCLRKQLSTTESLDNILNSIPKDAQMFLKQIADGGQSLLIAGATSSGKSTLLSALLQKHMKGKRVAFIETVNEQNMSDPSWFKLVSSSHLSLSPGDLVTQALRLSPEMFVISEIRETEKIAFWNALSSGHGGVWATIHGRSKSDVLERVRNYEASTEGHLLREKKTAYLIMNRFRVESYGFI